MAVVAGELCRWAARRGDTAKAALLLSHRADPDLACVRPLRDEFLDDQATPLLLAVGHRQVGIMRLLLAYHADPNRPCYRVGYNWAENVWDGAEVTLGNLTPTKLARAMKQTEILGALLRSGGDDQGAGKAP